MELHTAAEIRALILNPLIEISGELSACLSRMEKQVSSGLGVDGDKLPLPAAGALRALSNLRNFRRNFNDAMQAADDKTLVTKWRAALRKAHERRTKRDSEEDPPATGRKTKK